MTPLDQVAIDAALEILDSDYRSTDTPMSFQQRVIWRDVLAKLEPGELRPALAHLGYDRRPGPLEVLDVVQKARRDGTRPPRAKVPDIGRETLARAREDLRR